LNSNSDLVLYLMNPILLIFVHDLRSLISHRLALVTAAKEFGYGVKVLYGESGNTESAYLFARGIECVRIQMRRGGVNPIAELGSFFSAWKQFRKLRPEIVHLVTIKPYLYGGLAARLTGVPAVVSAVTGLGSMFIRLDWRSRLFRALIFPLYRCALMHPNQRVIFQNQDDAEELMSWGVLDQRKVRFLKGSGVDLAQFTRLDEPKGIPVICFAGRLIRDKGVCDLVSAARLLRERGVQARFWLAGVPDQKNPTGLTERELQALRKEANIEVLGYQQDIPDLYAKSHIVCLPSYREGLPKALAEAAAASRAIVTTDVPGCRAAIIPNVSGLLVPLKNPDKLAEALQWLIEHPQERVAMGKAGRQLAERDFSIEKIVRGHLDIYEELLDNLQ
jgi:glycosyltransferase involved in cell wall biosynthesis